MLFPNEITDPGQVDVALAVRAAHRTHLERRSAAGGGAAGRKPPAQRRQRLARLLEAVASAHRLAILDLLLQGPATYRGLQKATGLNVGPLYHHVNQLRSAGLIGPKERDLYWLTPAGRTLTLILQAAAPLVVTASK